jgi:hypothetical protein
VRNSLKSKTYYRLDADINQMGKYFPQLEYIQCANHENVKSLVNLSPDNFIIDTCSTLKLKNGSKRTDLLTFGSRYFIFSNKLKAVFDNVQLTQITWIPVPVDFSNGEVELLHVFYPDKCTFEDNVLDFEWTTFKILDMELDVVQKDLVLNASNPLNSMSQIRKEMGEYSILKIDKICMKQKENEPQVIDLFPFDAVNSMLISAELKNRVEDLKLTGVQFHRQEVFFSI